MVKATQQELANMDVEVTAEALAEQRLIEMGFVQKDNGSWYKPKAARKDRLGLSKDGEKNKRALLADTLEKVKTGYESALQILNGQVVRNEQTLPIAGLSASQIHWLDEQTQAIHDSVIGQLNAGHRMSTATIVVPD